MLVFVSRFFIYQTSVCFKEWITRGRDHSCIGELVTIVLSFNKYVHISYIQQYI